MSIMNGNPYVERLVTDQQPRTSESLATLALAYEQRTANLLHALEISYRAQSAELQIDPQTIAARLGLTTGATE